MPDEADNDRVTDTWFDRLFRFVYSDFEYWLVVPAILLIVALGTLGINYAATGEMVSKGIDFTGGAEIQMQVGDGVKEDEVQEALSEQFSDVSTRTLGDGQWMLIQTTDTFNTNQQQGDSITPDSSDSGNNINASEQIGSILDQHNIPYNGQINIRTMGAAVSGSFLLEAQIAVVVAFLIMSTAIFVAFRNFVPSIAVILAAFTDIVFALAGMVWFGINLTLGSLAALLMLIGYSVDTDIVLSTRVLREHKDDLSERIKRSTATGVTMSLGAIASFVVLYTVSTSPVLDQIAGVIIIGLLADMPITWLGNAVILKMHSDGMI